jgi:PKD repeat protein
MRRLYALAAGVVLCGVAGCEQTVAPPGPLQITLTASATSGAVGDSVTLTATAQGPDIIQLTADYGDGTVESHDIGGATTATARFKHAYSASGTYTIVATVTDGIDGTKADSVVNFPIS